MEPGILAKDIPNQDATESVVATVVAQGRWSKDWQNTLTLRSLQKSNMAMEIDHYHPLSMIINSYTWFDFHSHPMIS